MLRRLIPLVLFLSAVLSGSLQAEEITQRGRHETRLESGGYDRIYSVYTPDLDWEAMKAYGRAQPWDGEGATTAVLFFNDWRNTPDVSFSGMDINDHYRQYWVAGYWRYPNGVEMFMRYPAEKRKFTLMPVEQ